MTQLRTTTQLLAFTAALAAGVAATACDQLNVLVPESKGYAAAVRADNPLLYWRFEESGLGTAADSSGHGHAGLYLGTPTFSASVGATTGAAIKLVNSYGTFATDNGVVSGSGSWTELAALTLEAWVRPDKVTSQEGVFIIDKGDTWSLLIDRTGHPAFQFPWDPGRTLSGFALQPGQTYYLVGTYQPGPAGSVGKGVMKLYVNGQLVSEDDNAASAIPIPSSSTPIHVGTGLSSGRWGYSGVVDEAAVYDHALSAAAVLRHYDAGK